ncbi:MAG TPA: DUF5110 domain-containing protein, partial [Acidobacteriota bacterium]|nr:DUF5110 domain-containing protein [Acidobacteriota bacterium]
NPLRFDVYPDAQGAATGSLYEDDGISPAYQKGALRRTALSLADRKLTIKAEGAFQPAAREFEIVVHGVAANSVLVDGEPLSAAAWSRTGENSLSLRLSDNGQARVVEFR